MIQQVSYQILKGLIKAQQEYIKWSGGAFLSAFGPEHLATAYSFDFLKKIKPTPKYLVPEMLMETLRDDSGYDGYKTGRLYGNCDIAVYMKNQPTYVIELKRNSKINELTKDIDRITKLLKNKNCSIKAGFIGFIIESSKQINKKVDLQKILKDKINNILEDRKDVQRRDNLRADRRIDLRAKAPAKPARDNSWKMGDMASFSFDREMERREGCHRRGSRPPTRTSS